MTYEGRPVFDFTPNWIGPVQSITDDVSFDAVAAGGPGLPWTDADQAQAVLTFRYQFTRAELKALEDFQDSVRGRVQGFWLPGWCADFTLQTALGSSATVLEIDVVGLGDLFAAFPDQYRHLCFFLEDLPANLLLKKISTVAAGSNAEVITLTTTLGTAVAQDTKCSRLYYVRFADQRIACRYLTPELIEATIRFVELPREYAAAELGTRPVWLYRVTRGDTEWTWTHYPVAFAAGSRTWTPAPIAHSTLSFDKEFEDAAKLILATAAANHPFRAYLASPALEPARLQIFATEAPTFSVDMNAPFYEGELGAPRFRPRGVIEIQINSPLGAEDWPMPRHRLHRMCQYNVYDPHTCRLASAPLTVTAAITAIGANYIETPAFGAEATARSNPNWFALGDVTIGSEVRLVTSQSGNRLNLDAPFFAASPGDTAIVRWGCDLMRATCEARGNLVNFGGFAAIPSSDPRLEAIEPPAGGGKKGK